MQHTIIRGGRLIDIKAHKAEPADILIAGDSVAEIGPPGLAAPADAKTIDASGHLLHPGRCHGERGKEARRQRGCE